MDPTTTLRQIRALLATQSKGGLDPDQVCELVELVEALDMWLSAGGFLPGQWPPSSKLAHPCKAQHPSAGLCELAAGHLGPHRVTAPMSATVTKWGPPHPREPKPRPCPATHVGIQCERSFGHRGAHTAPALTPGMPGYMWVRAPKRARYAAPPKGFV